jgi:hypothetical protein
MSFASTTVCSGGGEGDIELEALDENEIDENDVGDIDDEADEAEADSDTINAVVAAVVVVVAVRSIVMDLRSRFFLRNDFQPELLDPSDSKYDTCERTRGELSASSNCVAGLGDPWIFSLMVLWSMLPIDRNCLQNPGVLERRAPSAPSASIVRVRDRALLLTASLAAYVIGVRLRVAVGERGGLSAR